MKQWCWFLLAMLALIVVIVFINETIASYETAVKPVSGTAVQAAKAATPVPEWYTKDDPATDFVSAVSPDSMTYAVAGTESWTLVNSKTGQEKVTTGSKLYLCPMGQGNAKELELPKMNGTNRFIRNVTSPVFSKGGDTVIATLHYQNGNAGKLFIVGWNVRTGAPKVLGKMPADLSHSVSESEMPSKRSLAYWYLNAEVTPGPVPRVMPHVIYIEKMKWDY